MRIAPDDLNRNEEIQEKIWAMHYSLKEEFFNICYDRFTASQAVNHFMLLVEKEVYPDNNQPIEDFGMGRYNIREALKDSPQIAEVIIKKAEDAANDLIEEIKKKNENRSRTIISTAYYLAASLVINLQNFLRGNNQNRARARIIITKRDDNKTNITREYFMNSSS